METSRVNTRGMVLSALFTSLIVVGTFIRVPVPVVPFTLQFLFTNLAALLLGSRWGSISVMVYVIAGLLGFPVFSSGGGIGYILHPTFGYLLGFIAGAFVAGKIVEHKEEGKITTFLAASFANLAMVYLIGMIYYYVIANYYLRSPIGVGALFIYCFALAVPGDVALCILSSGLAKRLKAIMQKGVL